MTSDIVTLTCPSCGGSLRITPDIERFACIHCGNEHLVRRTQGAVSLAPVLEALGQVNTRIDRAQAELALHRLQPELFRLEKEYIIYHNQWHKAAVERKNAILIGVVAILLMVGGLINLSNGSEWGFLAIVGLLVLGFAGARWWLSTKAVKLGEKDKAEILARMQVLKQDVDENLRILGTRQFTE